MSGMSVETTESNIPKPNVFGRFRKDIRGTTAIEFAILVVPFLLLLFAIIETSLSFATQQLMANSADNLARDIRVGNLKTAAMPPQRSSSSAFAINCRPLLVRNCTNDVVVDLKTYSDYASMPTTIPRNANKDVNTTGFNVAVGGPEAKQMLRVFYRWKYFTDLIGAQMAELSDRRTLLYTSAVWKNEPFSQ